MSVTQTSARPRLQLLDLPFEILQEILGYVQSRDLCRILLVCRELQFSGACALYRTVHHTFKMDEDKSGRADVDRFVRLLETLTACDYGYNSYIKQMSFDSVAVGEVNPARGSVYQSSYAYAKLLDLILRGLLQETDNLESFRWNAQIEITQSLVYSLSRLEKLQHLHIRLQSGSLREPFKKMKPLHPASGSIYTAPALYDSIEDTTSVPVAQYSLPAGHEQHHPHSNHHAPAHYHVYNNVSHQNFYPVTSAGKRLTAGSLAKELTTLGGLQPFGGKPTFSLFSRLKSLAVLDIDTLEYASELAICISSCASSLKSLKLSFSATLALKARRKTDAVVSDSESSWDMDNFDDLPLVAPPLPGVWNPAGTANNNNAPAASTSSDAEVRLERAAQEKALARILGAHKSSAHPDGDKGLEIALAAVDEELIAVTQQAFSDFSDESFVRTLRKIASEVPSIQQTTPKRLVKILEKLEKAADRYLERKETFVDVEVSSSKAEATSFGQNKPSTSKNNPISGVSEKSASKTAPKRSDGNSGKRSEDKITSEIDMDHPDHFEDSGDDQEFVEDVKKVRIAADADASAVDGDGGGASTEQPNFCGDVVSEAQPSNCSTKKGKAPVRDVAQLEDFGEKPESDSGHRSLEDYLRNIHGLPLQSLSLRLIPIKVSTLYEGIDFTTLKRLSLVNVGPQRTLWTLLWKLQQVSPMQLTAIHTDNVTTEFLEFVTGLPKVTELFLFESNRRAKIESLAPKTAVKIEDIRLKIIDKHIKHLRRLVIRNNEDNSWNLDHATVATLTTGGENLIELCAGINSHVFHIFMQKIHGLRNLFALQLIFHSPDGRCPLVIREMRSSIVDIVMHCSVLLHLEYIGMCDFFDTPSGNPITRLIRRRDVSRGGDGRVLESGRTSGVKTSVVTNLKTWQVSDVKMWETDMWGSWL